MAQETGRRSNSIQLRMNHRELAQFRKQAGREPLATWARRILVEYCDRREKKEAK